MDWDWELLEELQERAEELGLLEGAACSAATREALTPFLPGLLGQPEAAWPEEDAGRAPCALVLITSDEQRAAWGLLIPMDRLGDGLEDDLSALHGATFAGPADLRPERWEAAIRVLAAMGGGFGIYTQEELAEWADRDDAADTVAARWERWSGCDLTQAAQLKAPIHGVFSMRFAV